MSFAERRHLGRMEPEAPLYIDLKPDNGGIVLNVSKNGLCFQSVAPVNKHELLAFSFGEPNAPRDGVGEVVWIDKSRKFGGLRFTQVTAEHASELQARAELIQIQSREPALQLVPYASHDKQVMTALVPAEIEGTSPVHAALFREAHSVPINLPAPRSHKPWVQKTLIVVLAVWAVGASFALYRSSKHAVSATTLVAQAPVQAKLLFPPSSAPLTRTAPRATIIEKPLATAIAKPSAAVVAASPRAPAHGSPAATVVKRSTELGGAQHHIRLVAEKPASLSPEPARPVIQTAPLRLEYPDAVAGNPSGQVALRLLVNTAGIVEGVKVVSGKSNLASAAIRAARQWRYRPLQLGGQAVPAEAHVKLRFAGDDAVSISFHD